MKTAIQFSGGKDSLAVLYLNRDHLSDITVFFGDTGDVYPHVREFVHSTCEKLGITPVVISPPIPITAYHSIAGLPSDIVPVEAIKEMENHVNRPIKSLIQGSHACCGVMLWQPLDRALHDHGIGRVLRGAKACDGHVGVPNIREGGIEYINPIWDWTDYEVFSFLTKQGATLPKHYKEVNNSFDCLHCTAYLTSDGAKARLEYTKKHYPDQWPELKRRLNLVKQTIDDDRRLIDDALSMGD